MLNTLNVNGSVLSFAISNRFLVSPRLWMFKLAYSYRCLFYYCVSFTGLYLSNEGPCLSLSSQNVIPADHNITSAESLRDDKCCHIHWHPLCIPHWRPEPETRAAGTVQSSWKTRQHKETVHWHRHIYTLLRWLWRWPPADTGVSVGVSIFCAIVFWALDLPQWKKELWLDANNTHSEIMISRDRTRSSNIGGESLSFPSSHWVISQGCQDWS